jgi:hypothetical protein
MAPLLRHFGKVENGEALYFDLNLYLSNLQLLEGKEFELVIDERFHETTRDEHAFYRGGIIPTMMQDENFRGWEKDEIHAYLTNRFLGETVVKELRGVLQEVRKVPSTANIGRKRMAQFITDVITWLGTMGIEVKDPEQYVLNKYSHGKIKKEK